MWRNLFVVFLAGILLVSCDKECENEFGECPDEQLAKDVQLIQNYIEDNGLTAERHPSDLFYIIKEEGDGPKPNFGQEVYVNYVGRFLDGRVFDTPVDSVARQAGIYDERRTYEPYRFELGAGRVIRGWDIGISLINEGSQATLIIPSYLAYSFNGGGSIPPNTVLLFDVQLVDIKF